MPYPPTEPAHEHIRNALALVRVTLETGTVMYGNEGPGIVVSVPTLAALQGRLEAALDKLEPPPTVLDFPSPEDVP